MLFAASLWLPASLTAAEKQTVCTITVNSADEKETFRRYLPESKYRFVELVERGRPDWLASACSAKTSCDVLIISGHYDGGDQFFTDQLEAREFLPVNELERVSCSDSCPGLFSKLKEVHLFGCNTLDASANASASAEVVRSLLRDGHSPKDAARELRALNAGHGQSSRDRMRLVFKDVPVIYGFSSVAPLGPTAAVTLSSYFRANGAGEVGQGRASSRLLEHFAPFGMAVTQGMTERDPHAAVRRDVCQFADERLSDANKLGFVHQVLQRQSGEARVHLDRIQKVATQLDDPARRTAEVNLAFAGIANDDDARTRFLDFARDADQPAVRARMLTLARDLGWLTPEQRWAELAQMLRDVQAQRSVGVTEVNLACSLNEGRELDGAYDGGALAGGKADDVAHAAMRACLGNAEARARTLDALRSANKADVQIAQSYLRQRPITDATELRQLTESVVSMPASEAQVSALESLGRHYVSDLATLAHLTRLYSQTPSRAVQAAVAGVLIRADLRSIAGAQLVHTLQRDRRPSPAGDDIVDALIRRLQASG